MTRARSGREGDGLDDIVLHALCPKRFCTIVKSRRHSHGRKVRIMRKHLTIAFTGLVILFGATAFLSACHTVDGAGKDVTAAGHEISEEAKEHR